MPFIAANSPTAGCWQTAASRGGRQVVAEARKREEEEEEEGGKKKEPTCYKFIQLLQNDTTTNTLSMFLERREGGCSFKGVRRSKDGLKEGCQEITKRDIQSPLRSHTQWPLSLTTC